jgi:hypothetical protein
MYIELLREPDVEKMCYALYFCYLRSLLPIFAHCCSLISDQPSSFFLLYQVLQMYYKFSMHFFRVLRTPEYSTFLC